MGPTRSPQAWLDYLTYKAARINGDHLKPPWSELVLSLFNLLLYVLITSYFIYTLLLHPAITLDHCVLVPQQGAAYEDSHSLNRKAYHCIPSRTSLTGAARMANGEWEADLRIGPHYYCSLLHLQP